MEELNHLMPSLIRTVPAILDQPCVLYVNMCMCVCVCTGIRLLTHKCQCGYSY